MSSFLSQLKDNYSITTLYTREEKTDQTNVDTKNKITSSLYLKSTALSIPFLLAPTLASAADAFTGIHQTVMGIFDAGVVLVIIFAGASWALGHRSKAIELLIGACCGYLLARHAVNIRDYLKNI